MSLCEMRWTELSTTARRNLSERKRNAVSLIPLSDDVKKFCLYLTAEGERNASILKSDKKNVQAFSTLNSIALSKLILFNRERQGEASKILLKDWQFNKKANITSEMAGCISEVEKGLINILERFEIRGKRGRTVPILITKEINEWVQLLLDTRVHHINPLNSYLFASSSQDSHIRGSDSLRNHSSLFGAKQPELLRSNRLRKHVGTMAQVLNLDQSEMELLAGFLGHDIRVHREYYRLDIDALQLARVLQSLFGRKIWQLPGKKMIDKFLETGEIDRTWKNVYEVWALSSQKGMHTARTVPGLGGPIPSH